MTGNLLGEEINPIVDEQIKFRQQVQGAGYLENKSVDRSPKVLNYLNNRSSWIKFASGVSISGSAGEEKLNDFFSEETGVEYSTNGDITNLLSTGLAENIVLFNTVQRLNKKGEDAEYIRRSGVRNSNQLKESINKMYGGLGGNSRGLQPVPGITGMSVDCLNRGSIKKATVTIKAYNKFQFSLIEVLYLRLGYMMMLEWGWDKYIDNIQEVKGNPPNVTIEGMKDTIIDNQWFGTKRRSQDDMLSLIDGYESKYKGNYGGFFGKVVNFTWKLNTDNTYDITVNLITLGSVIESLKVNLPIPTQTKSTLNLLKENYLKTLGKSYTELEKEEKDSYTDKILANLGSDVITQWIANSIILDNSANEGSPSPDGSNNFFTHSSKTSSQKYVRFGHFLSILQDLTISGIQNGSSDVSSLELDFDIDTEYIVCGYENNLIPLSPNKVIFSVKFTGLDGLKTLGRKTETVISNLNNNKTPFASEDKGVSYGKILNCYLNLRHLADLLDSNKDKKGNVTLFEFLESICDSINESTGGLTDITPIIKDNKIVTFIDENPIKGYDNLLPSNDYKYTLLEINGYNNTEGTSNFVKNFSVQTKITPDLASMISIGAASDGGNAKDINAIPYRKWNQGLVNRYANSYVSLPPPKPKTKEQIQKEEDQKFKDALSKAITDDVDNTEFYTILGDRPGYSFTYNGYRVNGIITPGVAKLGLRGFHAKNQPLLSFGLNRYKQAIKDRENQKAIYAAANLNLVDNLTEAKNNYSYYLINSFGGELTEQSVVQLQKIKDNTPSTLGKLGLAIQTKSIFPLLLPPPNTSPRGFTVYTSNAKYWDFNTNIQSQGQNSFKLYLNQTNQELANRSIPIISGTGFIPLELGITMDGISGVQIYNKINVNTKVLPSSYPRALKFLAIGVNHKISGNIWNTELKTISVPVLSTSAPIEIGISTTPTVVTPTSSTAVGVLADTTSFTDNGFVGNKKLQPIQDLIAKYESRGNYYAKNRGAMNNNKSTTELKGLTVKEYLKYSELPDNRMDRLFAVGRYQYTPNPIRDSIKRGLLQLDEILTPQVQERLAGSYFFTGPKRKYLRNYLLAQNGGSKLDLEKAVQSVGNEWASMPVIFYKEGGKKIITGNVTTGISNSAYYGNKGNNPSTAKISVSVVVQALIQSRILMGNTPSYIPPYYSKNPNVISF
tara:strand:+ start:1260 stop:4799 length:3540 start_codon:yes stop_codon:yes gene_type:complete